MRRAGIIAAGLGERLRSAGLPKPLVPVAGRPLIHLTVDALAAGGADSITILLNTKGRAVRRSLESAFPRLAWRFLEWDSPSSWESFRKVCLSLAEDQDRFVVSTTDTLMRPDDAARFARRTETSAADALLAVTSFVDDEKPLWVDFEENGLIKAVGEDAVAHKFITCGLYGMSRTVAQAMVDRTHPRLRDYLKTAVRDGLRVEAVTLGKTIDVDRPEDVAVAEQFLKEGAYR